ncbi:MAG: pectin acetylesterase-family hydrolase [Chloroflexota bacterium]|nr:pectin acetylesterase-family hydrolase [Chloroflexota bacterium]
MNVRLSFLLVFVAFALMVALPALAQESPSIQAAGWERIASDGATTCLRGDPYAFFARAGDPSNLIIYFQGGGACWDDFTCRPGVFADDTVNSFEMALYDGVFNFEAPTNPLADPAHPLYDASIVFVAYCSGDLHGGDRERVYRYDGQDHTLQHRGAVNTAAALDWTYERYPAPRRLLITGSSAGGYGALINAPQILTHYAAGIADGTTRAHVFADASPGIYPVDWNPSDYWGAYDELGMVALLEAFPTTPIGFYSTDADFVSTYAYTLQGGTIADYQGLIAGMARDLAAAYPNFSAYIPRGDSHVILALPDYYTLRVNGVRFAAWFAAWLMDAPVQDVICRGC